MHSSAAIDNLYPALAECFTIIVIGYFAGRIKLVSEAGAKGINTFVSTFSLPSLMFMALAKLDLSSVNWMFLVSIFIAKNIVFFVVIAVSLLVDRPVNLGRAGILAIFCTLSNDFAIGYPIVAALYKDSHPEYASYMYLMAPICFVYLNPIGFVFMEIGKQRTNNASASALGNNNNTRCKMFAAVVKGVVFNPIIAMTVLGIFGNFIFKHEVPSWLAGILNVLSAAFSASALFLLGLQMVGKIHTLRGPTLMVSGVLIIVKLLVLPLLIREVVNLMHVGTDEAETNDWSTYGFFYGTFPTGATVFLFATHYNQDVDLVASGMVACTFISAPLMFVSAKMVTITNADPSDYINKLHDFTFDLSIAGLIACVLVILVFIITKRINRIPHRITAYLVLSQLLSCFGTILWHVHNQHEGSFGYFQFAIFTTGVYSSRIWTIFLAVVLVLLRYRSLCYVLRLEPLFIIVGWGLPILLSTLFVVLDKKNSADDKRDPNFVYGTSQAVVAVSFLFFSFIMTVSSLIVHQRYNRRYSRHLDLAVDVCTNFQGTLEIPTPIGSSSQSSDNSLVSIVDLLNGPSEATAIGNNLCPTQCSCHPQQTINDMEVIEEEPESHDPQIFKHTVLLILLLCSMLVGLSLSIWTLVMEKMSGVYIELSFLDASLNIGQSIIVFAIFGTNSKEVVLPIWRCCRKLWYGANELSLPSCHELSTETKYVCDQFVTHHLSKCTEDIVKDMRWRMKVYEDVFSGTKLVDWLIDIGLAGDRAEAVDYARRLIEGRVLKHIHRVYDFHDSNLLYTFN